MPYRDIEKRRRCGREKQARFRERQRLESIGVAPPELHPAQRERQGRPRRAVATAPGADEFTLNDPELPHSQRCWTQQKIAVGREVLKLGLESLRLQGNQAPLGGRDALSAIRMGLDLLEQNFELPVEVPEERFPTMQLMADPEFRELAERQITRQAEIMLGKDPTTG